jgi:hypothetical protein
MRLSKRIVVEVRLIMIQMLTAEFGFALNAGDPAKLAPPLAMI